jgi:hypothetical protein
MRRFSPRDGASLGGLARPRAYLYGALTRTRLRRPARGGRGGARVPACPARPDPLWTSAGDVSQRVKSAVKRRT